MGIAPSDVDAGHLGDEDHFQRAGSDRRVSDLMDYVLQMNPLDQNFAMMQDPLRTAGTKTGRFDSEHSITLGKVVQAIPYLNWYKIQVGKAGTFVPGCMLSQTNLGAIGVRSTSPVGPNSTVLCFMPKGLGLAFILGVIPEQITSGEFAISDWIQQGGCTGLKREKAHKQPISQFFREGGVRDFSNRRPIDSTLWEWGMMSETGIGILIDSFQAYLRVNEACGLFLNYWDSYCRLAAFNMDFQTFCQHVTHREDEGENVFMDSRFVYPWEALGMYGPGEAFTKENSDEDVHYKKAVGKVDLKDKDNQPFSRFIEYGGYLGQPMMRMVVAPPNGKDSGLRKYGDDDKDVGLFQEAISLDGSYLLRSAKTIIFGHRVLIPVPKRKKHPEDQKGDNAKDDNYKFSGKHGGGDEHKVGDVKIEGENKHLTRVSGVLDLLCYAYNWKSLHPFHYHKEDYKLWQESELSEPFDRAQDKLDFYVLSSRDAMEDPTPKKVKVDHRYGEVEYYQRESFLVFHEDGGIQLGCGYGSGITMSAGNVYIDAPGSIYLRGGKRVVYMAWDVILRAYNSVDISANKKDVRIKAEKNMQFLAGNGNKGGMIFDCRSKGSAQVYQDKYGEDVQASGIVFITRESEIGLLGKDIYLRTGGGEIKDGRITIDASKGKHRVSIYGKQINMFANKSVQIFHSPMDETCNTDAAHRFSKSTSIISGSVIVEKNLTVTKGNLVVKKSVMAGGTGLFKSLWIKKGIGAGGTIFTKKKMAQDGGGMLGDSELAPTPDYNIDGVVNAAEQARTTFMKTGDATFQGDMKTRWYVANKLGNNETIRYLGFSYRDPPSSTTQYKTDQFMFPECRWQQMVRMGNATGGTGWTEKPVLVGGKETYPWPGKKMWCEEDVMLKFDQHSMYDAAQGRAMDRPGPYEEPELGGSSKEKLQGNWKIAIQ